MFLVAWYHSVQTQTSHDNIHLCLRDKYQEGTCWHVTLSGKWTLKEKEVTPTGEVELKGLRQCPNLRHRGYEKVDESSMLRLSLSLEKQIRRILRTRILSAQSHR